MEIIISIVSFLLGYFVEKIMDLVAQKVSNTYHIKTNKSKKLKLKKRYAIDAVCTEEIYPYVLPKNIWVKHDVSKSLFLTFPKELLAELKGIEGEFATEDHAFCKLTMPGYTDQEIATAIDKARFEIATKFVKREDGLYFNGEKFGVSFLDSKSRTMDIKEEPQLFLEFYRTDHFTHRVISRAVEILNPPVSMLNSEFLNQDLKWIRTSFGVSIIVVLKSVNQIIMTHRSQKASFCNGKNWIYVSATEALSKSDIDEYDSQLDLTLCVIRGIKEELGIDKSLYSHDRIQFHDCFFETHFYQDGIVASVELSEEIFPQDILEMRAKDKQMEIEDIFFVDNTKSDIQKFIHENHTDMRSQTIFALEAYLSTL